MNFAAAPARIRREVIEPCAPAHTVVQPTPQSHWALALTPYVQIARMDHWFKNVFMVLGVVLALFYSPHLPTSALFTLPVAVIATCLVASSNYVLNELLDGPTDALHPKKHLRPVPSGAVKPWIAYIEWLSVGLLGIALATTVNVYFALSATALWVMGVAYNVPPVRTKEWPYLDVISESANNAIRLFLGWFALLTSVIPPLSLVFSYWMLGAFFMATKRYAEYRHINDPIAAASYRRSFGHYNEERLLISILFYATTSALFGGIFIVRYHLELILVAPIAAGVFAYYLRIGMRRDSPVQNPEQLFRERGFFMYLVATFVLFVVLMFTRIPMLYQSFNVDVSATSPLWTLGRP